MFENPPISPLALSLNDLSASIARKEYKAAEVTELALQRIQKYDAELHAFCLVDGDGAR